MNERPIRAETPGGEGNRAQPVRDPLAALLATAHDPLANQVEEQPPAPTSSLSSGFDTTGNDVNGQGDARGY